MKWVLYLLLFSVVMAFFGLWYLQDPGNIIITWLGYEVQFSVFSGFIFCIILYTVIFVFLRLFYRLRSFLSYCLLFFQRSKHKKDNSETLF